MDYGTGRIGEIINALKDKFSADIIDIPAEAKLSALCEVTQLTSLDFDKLISENSPVLRTVRGHTFESFFDNLIRQSGHEITEVGGDDSVDRIVNNRTLQLKTYTKAGTSGVEVQFKTHKTHGAKSEQESFDYYHTASDFAEFLVGLISYDPLNILVLGRNELPRHSKSPEHILSPFSITWEGHPGLNNFKRISATLEIIPSSNTLGLNELLPKTAAKIGVGSDVILNTILNNANFRIWDMAIRGFAREIAFSNYIKAHSVKIYNPSSARTERSDKADYALRRSGKYVFMQMKGVSTNHCDFSADVPLIATETQLTRGRVNDHPTQSRLYLNSDFDFLILGIDPPINKLCQAKILQEAKLEWAFYAIPTEKLEKHKAMPNRLKYLQKFLYTDLQKYKVLPDWFEPYEQVTAES